MAKHRSGRPHHEGINIPFAGGIAVGTDCREDLPQALRRRRQSGESAHGARAHGGNDIGRAYAISAVALAPAYRGRAEPR
jgi:hypothetical protein